MFQLPMQTLVEFAVTKGLRRFELVRAFKEQRGYDFWRGMRKAIVEHTKAGTVADLRYGSAPPADKRIVRIAPTVVAGYQRFFFDSPKTYFDLAAATLPMSNHVDVRIEPDVCLVINGIPHGIFMHFPVEKPSKLAMSCMLRLAAVAWAHTRPDLRFAVLDVPRVKLVAQPPQGNPRTFLWLRGELSAFATMYESV